MKEKVLQIVSKQLEHLFETLNHDEISLLGMANGLAFEQVSEMISKISIKGYNEWNPYHSCQYAMYLYRLSKALVSMGAGSLADRVYYLNKIMNSIELYHNVDLPELFYFEHPIGTVLGKADYGNEFSVYQGCTVGGIHNHDMTANYPVIGDQVIMFSHSSIIGNCRIGSHTIIASNTVIKNQDIPDNSIVFGVSPHLTIKENKRLITFFKGR